MHIWGIEIQFSWTKFFHLMLKYICHYKRNQIKFVCQTYHSYIFQKLCELSYCSWVYCCKSEFLMATASMSIVWFREILSVHFNMIERLVF